MSATLRLGHTRGQPILRRFERGVRRPLPPSREAAERAAARLTVVGAVLRGTLTVPEAARVLDMLGLLPGQEGTS